MPAPRSTICVVLRVVGSDEDDAEVRCDEAVSAALVVDPFNVEALVALGNLRLCQHKRDDAVAAVERACATLRPAGMSVTI